MNLLKYIRLFGFLFLLGTLSCVENEDPTTGNSKEGGMVTASTPAASSINFVVGNGGENELKLRVFQGPVKVSNVEIYKSFYSVEREEWSNEVLLESIAIENNEVHDIVASYTYEELIADLKINDEPLPASDTELTIGDRWSFKIVSVKQDGSKAENRDRISLSVSTRFAGTYLVEVGNYLHPTLGLITYPGIVRIIESVDATTYKSTAVAYFDAEDNHFYFTIDENDNVIIPKEYNGEVQNHLNGWPISVCQNNELPDAACENRVERSDDGKDKIFMSYGYHVPTGETAGTRQFSEVLTKLN